MSEGNADMAPSEYVSVAEARHILGVSEPKIAQMIRDGLLPWEPNPVDKRGKIIKREVVEAIAAKLPPKMPPKSADAA
jgi:hypothetical protein